jgi:hypothetical protein
VSSADFRIQVLNADEPFLLVLKQAFAPGWRIAAPGRDPSELRHVVASGYANGWLIPWRGTYELRISYGPERFARAARWSGLFLLPVLLLWNWLPRWRRQHKHRAVAKSEDNSKAG